MKKQDQLTRNRLRKVHAMLKSGRLDEARVLCEKLCARKGAGAEPMRLLAEIYKRQGRTADALGCLQRAVQAAPDDADAWTSLADAMLHQGILERAAEYYREAVRCRPDNPRLLTNLAGVLSGLQRPSEAEPLLRRAIELDPSLPQPHTNLGGCLKAQGKVDEALECYEQGLATAADDPMLHSNYLLARHYVANQDPQASLAAHLEWARRHAPNARQACDFAGQDHGDRLRVGYISPDFRTHSVAYFLAPLFANHDREHFEIYCYSDVRSPDAMTQRLKGRVDCWRHVPGLGDEELDRRIRADEIDILVDLAGHTAGNRMRLFARRCAPVQLTWLGYPDTTGIGAMDYRVSDLHADPAGCEAYCSEKLIRLKECFLCYQPPSDAPEPAVAAFREKGFITFGSFNNLSKINDVVVELWAGILQQVPGARLVIKNPGLTDAAVRADYLSRFARRGVDDDRVILKGLSATTREHLGEYRHIDIGLDTFPYNGTTTTCEAMWMGVPVLTLTGSIHAGRVGSSLLSAAGMEQWIADSPDDYVALAVKYAGDTDFLERQQDSLRERMANSVLCDGSRFAAAMEAAYRSAWQAWMASSP